jgi:hypothetical protein
MKTTKAQHTSGEWRFEHGNIVADRYICSLSDWRIDGETAPQYQEINDQLKAERLANARLIASAPLMLEALEGVLNMGDDYEAEKLVRQAIKQARGE